MRALVAGIVAAGALASVARADGDPASDYLLSKQVFLTSESTSESPAERQLVNAVQAANRSGFSIRVAIISTDYDLGSITELWHRPRIYARFLGLELSGVYKQRLLVVMPNGYGFNWPGHHTTAAYRQLAKTPITANGGENGLLRAAQAAVGALAAAAGTNLTVAPHNSSSRLATSSRSANGLLIAAAALATILVALGIAVTVRWQLRRRRIVAAEVSLAGPRAMRIRLRWASATVALLVIAGVGAIVALSESRHAATAAGETVSSLPAQPQVTWPAGQRSAPQFLLHDQRGDGISLAAYRGRPVIVTFIDPLCRNFCPLAAQVLNHVVDQLPASQRPEILAVSVDVYANTRKDLLQDVHKWRLVPEWRWAVGSPAQLAAVWKRYEIGVSVITKRIAGTTIRYITHTEAAYIIDRTGHQRALFLWPFYPQDIEHALRQLT